MTLSRHWFITPALSRWVPCAPDVIDSMRTAMDCAPGACEGWRYIDSDEPVAMCREGDLSVFYDGQMFFV